MGVQGRGLPTVRPRSTAGPGQAAGSHPVRLEGFLMDPMLRFDIRSASDCPCGKGVPGQAAALRFGGQRCAPSALRCSVSRPPRRTHFVHTAATSQPTKRASRVAAHPALLGASEARCSLPDHAIADMTVVFAANSHRGAERQAQPGGGAVCGGEKRRPGVGAQRRPPRSAPPPGGGCRDARNIPTKGRPRTAASGRKPSINSVPMHRESA